MTRTIYQLSRRPFLKLMISAALIPGTSAGSGNCDDVAAQQFSIVSLNTPLTQTLVALGLHRFGATALRDYVAMVVEPALPDGAIDIGTAAEPNLELLAQLQPRVILHSPEWGTQPAPLQRIAPVVELPIYRQGTDMLPNALHALQRIGEIAGVHQAGRQYMDYVEATFASLRRELTPFRSRPLLALLSPSARQMWTYGRGSLFDATLHELGLRNAISEYGDVWGFSPITMAQLASVNEVTAVHLGPIPETLRDNPFWQALPAVKSGKLVIVPEPVWMWGGLPSVERFARVLAVALKAA